MIYTANRFWKYYLFVFYASFVPMSIIVGYGLLQGEFYSYEKLVILLFSTGNVLVMLTLSLNAASIQTSAYMSYDNLYCLTVKRNFSPVLDEINMFLMRLNYDNIGFSCWDLFTIKPSILTTVTTAILTYLLALKNQ
ncbi:Gustatory receptor-like protein [Dinothrombium tinctorium]|uniref:Gustatory receptor-like protein n=1 Tax=Dinothrombium tinctorium TaxID=1965070 RepID=A0A3S3RSJ8_9ACAR|nr:Gustatory receptor-like protein [Dinothrombium tinctorium]RWS05364.1 Gustatory receptor-like protein [Dinothrombium tinctorium]RWS06861.1 Gustatory receptor-like protein [Dinothrombium tinctorium]